MSLLDDVLAAPEDTTLRLVLADQLTEAGDPQGPFITHQCALATMDALDPEYARLAAVTERLQARHAESWLPPLLKGANPTFASRFPVSRMRNARFERGFLKRIALTPEELPLLEGLRKHSPVSEVQLLVGEGVPDTPVPPSVAEWTGVQVSPDGWFTASSVAVVLGWGLKSAEEIDLSGCSLGTAGVQLLTGEGTDLGEYFDAFVAPEPVETGQLKRLFLKNTGLYDEGLAVLLRSERLVGLEELGLEQCRLSDGDILKGLRKAPWSSSLEALSIAGNNDLDITALAGWERIQVLRRLGLPRASTPADFATWFPEPSAHLRELELAGAKDLLADAPAVFGASTAFTHLGLSTTRLGDKGFTALVEAPSTQTLRSLELNGCSLSDKAMHALVASGPQALNRLDVSSNKLTNAGAEALAQWPGLAHVTFLRIGNNRKLGEDGYRALVASPHFDPVVLDVGKLAAGPVRTMLEQRFGSALHAR